MENRGLVIPGVKDDEFGYGLAYKLAAGKLAGIDDIAHLCDNSGAAYRVTESGKVITVEYLNRQYRVTLPDVDVSAGDGAEVVPLREKILVLHYLTQAKGTPASGKTIAYKELPEGISYFRTFCKRAIKPLTDHFGTGIQRLPDIARTLGGYKADYGDTAVTINAFPRVPLTFVLWGGDEEFPPEGNILFDSNIADYLSIEDINVLCETIAWKLVKSLWTGGDKNSRRS
ncbi:DUF3786 domain-containing protein [Chloroflexota bacterium]